MTKLIGIDDAGRGPVLGPMIIAGILINESEEKDLYEIGVKDSKLIAPHKRKQLGDKISKKYNYHIEKSSPKEIDESTNLNYLEAIKTAKIINKLTENLSEKIVVIVDCPSVNIKAWSEDVQKLLKNPEIIALSCEHKADVNHPVVSAASILAKEKRESEIYKLKLKFKTDFGSGYPADPKTKKFIVENFNNKKYKDIIRFSWKTVKKLFDNTSQKNLF